MTFSAGLDESSSSITPATVLKNHSLSHLNTMGLAASAEAFAVFHSMSDLLPLLDAAAHRHWPVTVLGGGSNVLLADRVDGLVVQSINADIEVLQVSSDNVLVRVGAGKCWHDWVRESVQYGHGLENLALIPGSVGAAPIQNIGAYGVEVEQRIDSVIGFQISTRQLRRLSREECRFGYRDSIFKRELSGDFIVTSVVFSLSRRFQPNLSYGPLADWESRQSVPVSPLGLIEAVSAIRASRLPDPATIPNAGSFFKNPIVSQALAQCIGLEYADMPCYPVDDPACCKLAAGWLIEQAGWKGKSLGKVGMHTRQALVMVNQGGAVLDDVLSLKCRVQSAVYEQFGVRLEAEPVIVGRCR